MKEVCVRSLQSSSNLVLAMIVKAKLLHSGWAYQINKHEIRTSLIRIPNFFTEPEYSKNLANMQRRWERSFIMVKHNIKM